MTTDPVPYVFGVAAAVIIHNISNQYKPIWRWIIFVVLSGTFVHWLNISGEIVEEVQIVGVFASLTAIALRIVSFWGFHIRGGALL